MTSDTPSRSGEAERLLQIIHLQTDIARLGVDLGQVMALATEQAQRLTAADGAVIELAEGQDMVYRACSGQLAPYLGLRLRRDGSLSGYCVAEGRALRCDDSESDPRVDREACRRVGLRSMVVAPLRHHELVVGALKVCSARAAAFDDVSIQTLELISNLLASAMYHAARFESSELFHRATHDALTNLPNRALFFERLRAALAQASRERSRFALLMLDMDGLKPINDGYGHRAGDAALTAFADLLRRASRATDTVARLGGDEFAILLGRVESREGLEVHTRRLLEHSCQPFVFEGLSTTLQTSLGSALYPDDADTLEGLIEFADQAMYVHKRQRKSTDRAGG